MLIVFYPPRGLSILVFQLHKLAGGLPIEFHETLGEVVGIAEANLVGHLADGLASRSQHLGCFFQPYVADELGDGEVGERLDLTVGLGLAQVDGLTQAFHVEVAVGDVFLYFSHHLGQKCLVALVGCVFSGVDADTAVKLLL